MPDELSLLKQLGSASDAAPADLERDVRRQLLVAIAREQALHGPRGGASRWLDGWRLRSAVAVAAGAAAAFIGLLVASHGRTPSIADNAYAALSERVGIMHFVQQYGLRGDHAYEEYWIDLQHPSRQRIVQSSGGKVTRQLVYTGGYSSYYSESGTNHNPLTIISKTPPNPNGGVTAGVSPIAAYRKLLHAGTVISETKTTYNGRPAYRLVIRYTPPYNLVGDVWTGDQITYTVDGTTYYPLELRFRPDPTMGGGPSLIRYPVFEIVPATASSQQLLKPVGAPKPYSP
jgi:hypothetical protein